MSDSASIRVTYIISTRNRAEFLEQVLCNVAEFITPADELLVIDGASTDHTAAVAERHRGIITAFVSEPDSGEAHGFNKGLLLARGRYIKFLTDDDYIYPEAMRTLVATMEQHPEVEAVLCGGEEWSFDPATQASTFLRYGYLPEAAALTTDERGIYLHATCGVGLMVSRSLLARAGLFDTRYLVVDTEYMARLIALGCRFHYLHVKLFRHTNYPHSGSLVAAHRAEVDRMRILLAGGYWPRLLASDPMDVAQAMGLLALPGGRALMQWIWLGERLRRFAAVRPLLALAALVTSALQWAGKQGYNVRQRLKPQSAALTEPQWDGRLRG